MNSNRGSDRRFRGRVVGFFRRDRWLRAGRTLLGCVAIAAATAAQAGTMIGDYNLAGGSYANSLSGSAALGSLSVVSTSGTFGFVTSGTSPGWFWSGATSPGTGLSLSGLPANDGTTFGNYSIGMRFSMPSVTGLYKRLMLFKSGQDFGPYVANGAFEFYDAGANPSGGSITANTPVDFVLTRSGATKQINAYMNGSQTPIFTFTDTANDGQTASLAPRTIQFFIDNGPEFSAAGGIGLLRVWNGPLAAADIPNAMAVVPEPAAGLLAIVGAAALGWWLRRRRTDAP